MNTHTWRRVEHIPFDIRFADKFGRIHVRKSRAVDTLGHLNDHEEYVWEFDESREYLDATVVEMDGCDVFDAHPYYSVGDRVERYVKDSWTGGSRERRIVFHEDGSTSYPDGVPLANDYPDVMTPEYARSVFRAYGYGLVDE